jgi:hypothetical protein
MRYEWEAAKTLGRSKGRMGRPRYTSLVYQSGTPEQRLAMEIPVAANPIQATTPTDALTVTATRREHPNPSCICCNHVSV